MVCILFYFFVCGILTTAVAATIAETIHFEIHRILKWLMSDLALDFRFGGFCSILFLIHNQYIHACRFFSIEYDVVFFMDSYASIESVLKCANVILK